MPAADDVSHQHDAIWSLVPSIYNLTIFDQESCSKLTILSPEGNCKCCGGCASFVRTTVLLALSVKPTCDSTVAKSCKSEIASAYYFANNRMSSAKRRSSSAGWPSPKSNPFKGTSRLQPVIAHCSTAKNTRGLRTHPCLTPEVMGKLRPDPHLPRTSPDWPSYSFDSIHIMWAEMPWARNAFQRVGQCTRSNAFERSKLTIQTGIPCAVALSRNKLAVSKCSSSRYFERNPCGSSGWWVSSVCLIRPRIKYAKTLYSNRTVAIGLKSLTCIARIFWATCENRLSANNLELPHPPTRNCKTEARPSKILPGHVAATLQKRHVDPVIFSVATCQSQSASLA